MRGRKPTPTVLFELHGKPNKARAQKPNKAEPKPVTGNLFEAPDWMSATQKIGWDYAIAHAPPGLLSHIDAGVLAVWVVAEDLHRRATVAQNNANSLMVKAPLTGTPLQSPYLAVINKQGLMMIKAAGELGFSPVSRPRIGAGAPLPMVPEGRMTDAGEARPSRPSFEDFLASHPDRQTQH
jgi:phage terminase small subunit